MRVPPAWLRVELSWKTRCEEGGPAAWTLCRDPERPESFNEERNRGSLGPSHMPVLMKQNALLKRTLTG